MGRARELNREVATKPTASTLVREVIFGMRFCSILRSHGHAPNLGESPSSPFEPEPRQIDIDAVLVGIER